MNTTEPVGYPCQHKKKWIPHPVLKRKEYFGQDIYIVTQPAAGHNNNNNCSIVHVNRSVSIAFGCAGIVKIDYVD